MTSAAKCPMTQRSRTRSWRLQNRSVCPSHRIRTKHRSLHGCAFQYRPLSPSEAFEDGEQELVTDSGPSWTVTS